MSSSQTNPAYQAYRRQLDAMLSAGYQVTREPARRPGLSFADISVAELASLRLEFHYIEYPKGGTLLQAIGHVGFVEPGRSDPFLLEMLTGNVIPGPFTVALVDELFVVRLRVDSPHGYEPKYIEEVLDQLVDLYQRMQPLAVKHGHVRDITAMSTGPQTGNS